jgi:hypothetical protein
VEYRGHDGIRAFWSDWKSIWRELTIDPQEMVDAGDSVVVRSKFTGVGRHGVEVSTVFNQVYTFTDDGRLIRFQSFGTWEEAMRAAEAARV